MELTFNRILKAGYESIPCNGGAITTLELVYLLQGLIRSIESVSRNDMDEQSPVLPLAHPKITHNRKNWDNDEPVQTQITVVKYRCWACYRDRLSCSISC